MTQLAFERSGTGAPMVLLHGLGMSRRAWDPVLPALAGRFEVIAIDLPGHGRSEPFPDDVEPLPATMAASVANLLDELGIADPHVVGQLAGWVGGPGVRPHPGRDLADAAFPGRTVVRQRPVVCAP